MFDDTRPFNILSYPHQISTINQLLTINPWWSSSSPSRKPAKSHGFLTAQWSSQFGIPKTCPFRVRGGSHLQHHGGTRPSDEFLGNHGTFGNSWELSYLGIGYSQTNWYRFGGRATDLLFVGPVVMEMRSWRQNLPSITSQWKDPVWDLTVWNVATPIDPKEVLARLGVYNPCGFNSAHWIQLIAGHLVLTHPFDVWPLRLSRRRFIISDTWGPSNKGAFWEVSEDQRPWWDLELIPSRGWTVGPQFLQVIQLPVPMIGPHPRYPTHVMPSSACDAQLRMRLPGASARRGVDWERLGNGHWAG